MVKDKILLFGGSGFLGSRILKLNKNIISPIHTKVDLTKIEAVYKYIEEKQPSKIIYTAGISKLDFSEKNRSITDNLNYKIPNLLSKFASKNNIIFYYISTDAVFDGYKLKSKFSEKDKTNAISVYGRSKEKGENAVLSNSNANSVIRVINLFGIGNKDNFLQKMIDTLSKNKEFNGITDQINNPLNVNLAAEAILFAISNNLKGIYNLGSIESVSNHNLLIQVAKKYKLDPSLIKKITFKEFMIDKIATRKQNSILITDKFQKASNGKILKNINDSVAYLNL